MKLAILIAILMFAALNGCAARQQMSIFDIPPGQTYILTLSGDDYTMEPAPQRPIVHRPQPQTLCVSRRMPFNNELEVHCVRIHADGRRTCVPATAISSFRQ